MKIKTIEAIEHNGKLYRSQDDLLRDLASDVIYDARNSGEWCRNPKATYLKLKDIYKDAD